jgi:predicted lactoylglutathione lyase
MATKIFVNLPVKDLERSMDFFTKLGFSYNPQFTDEKAACMIIAEDIYAMLLTEPFFKNFTKKEIVDAKKATESIICLSAESRDKVDEMVSNAVAAGGSAPNPKQDHGVMYGHGFEDLDGHLWELMWMDEKMVQQGQ